MKRMFVATFAIAILSLIVAKPAVAQTDNKSFVTESGGSLFAIPAPVSTESTEAAVINLLRDKIDVNRLVLSNTTRAKAPEGQVAVSSQEDAKCRTGVIANGVHDISLVTDSAAYQRAGTSQAAKLVVAAAVLQTFSRCDGVGETAALKSMSDFYQAHLLALAPTDRDIIGMQMAAVNAYKDNLPKLQASR